MFTLRQRSSLQEFIDNQAEDSGLLHQTYRQIRTINGWIGGYYPVLNAINFFLSRYSNQHRVSILDVGCGDGETLRQIQRRFHSKNLELTGVDRLEPVIVSARSQTYGNDIHFSCEDVLLDKRPDQTYDLVISSLVMHHLSDKEITKLLGWMTDHVRWGWFISDLHRNFLAYYFIKYFSRILRLNHLICHDAPLSVARGFRRKEWIRLLTKAGLDLKKVTITWYPNFHYGIRYEK